MKPTRQGERDEPIIDRGYMPRMGEREQMPREIAAGDSPLAGPGKRMAVDEGSGSAPGKPHGPQRSRPPGAQDVPQEKYVRLRVALNGNVLSVVSAHEVPGPLLLQEEIHGQYAYEVDHAGERIAAEAMQDLATSRSWPRPGQQEHFIHTHPNFEFNVRIPHAELAVDILPQVSLILYEFNDAAPKRLLGRQSIAVQYAPQVKKIIARSAHLSLDTLSPDVQDALMRTLPATK